MEKTLHKVLKSQAIEILKDMGFRDNEIHEEYPITINANNEKIESKHVTYRVDVAGISNDKRIAIECGSTQAIKIVWLKPFFDEVIILPHIRTFASEEEKATYQLRHVKKKFADTEKSLNEQIDKLTKENRKIKTQLITVENKIALKLIELLFETTSWSLFDLEYSARTKLDRLKRDEPLIEEDLITE